MYQFSRAIYRELARDIVSPGSGIPVAAAHEDVLKACEAAVDRLATDRHYFAKPSRSLFNDVRIYFPMMQQHRVYRVIDHFLRLADEYAVAAPRRGYDAQGNPLECRATTRKGTACQRAPLPHNGYCPSHQHLAETEDLELAA